MSYWNIAPSPAFILDLNRTDKVFADSSFTTAGALNDTIGGIQDISGNARHVSQSTAANEPLWVSWDAQERAILFADSTDILNGNSAMQGVLNAAPGFTLSFVVEIGPTLTTAYRLFNINTSGGSTWLGIYIDGSPNDGKFGLLTRRAHGGTQDGQLSASPLVAGTRYVVLVSVDYVNRLVYGSINGTQVFSATPAWLGDPSGAEAANSNGVTISHSSPATLNTMSGFVAWRSYLTAAQRSDIVAYQRYRFDI